MYVYEKMARNGEKRRETAIQFKDKKNHYNKRAG